MASKRSRGWWSPILPWHDCKKIQISLESGSDEGHPIGISSAIWEPDPSELRGLSRRRRRPVGSIQVRGTHSTVQ
jgi:hypothetical protein